jgi:hypothetical protein
MVYALYLYKAVIKNKTKRCVGPQILSPTLAD